MISIAALWMPILLAAVLVFVASSVIHMVLKYHASEYRGLPDEEANLASLRGVDLTPGIYTFPHCESMKEMGSPEMLEKYKRGPVGVLTVWPSAPPAMGKSLTLWFLYSVLIGVVVAYLAGRFLSPGTDYLAVFRFTGTAAFLAYGIGPIVDSIWKGAPWSGTLKAVFDGLVYSLLTAGAFGWLWP